MSTYLMHHGIKGQRWGVRRFQNSDGTLTDEGKQRYAQATEHYNDGSQGLRYVKNPGTFGDSFRAGKTRAALRKSYHAYSNYKRLESKANKLAEEIRKDLEDGRPNEKRSEKLTRKGEKLLSKEAKLIEKLNDAMGKSVQTIKKETAKHGKEKVDFWMAEYGYSCSVETGSDGVFVIEKYHGDWHRDNKAINEVIRKHANEG